MIVGHVDATYFESDEAKELYKTIEGSVAKTGEAPLFRLIVEDPSLSREARSFFRDSQAVITTSEEAKRAVKVLGSYRQTRGLYDILAETSRKMQGSKIDSVELLQTVGEEIGRLQVTRANKVAFTHIGKGNNSKGKLHDLLYGEDDSIAIPTGIEVFDKESRGFLRGSLVTIGASSGGGKCLDLDTRIQLTTIRIELDDDGVLEAEPEDEVWVTRDHTNMLVKAADLQINDEVVTFPRKASA